MKKKIKKEKTIDRITSIGVTVGILIMLIGLFSLLKIDMIYLIFFLILVDSIIVLWKFSLERKLK